VVDFEFVAVQPLDLRNCDISSYMGALKLAVCTQPSFRAIKWAVSIASCNTAGFGAGAAMFSLSSTKSPVNLQPSQFHLFEVSVNPSCRPRRHILLLGQQRSLLGDHPALW
jgi:hypothetical protein